MELNKCEYPEPNFPSLCNIQPNLIFPPDRLNSAQSTPASVSRNAYHGVSIDNENENRSRIINRLPRLRYSHESPRRSVLWRRVNKQYKRSISSILARAHPRKVINQVNEMIDAAKDR